MFFDKHWDALADRGIWLLFLLGNVNQIKIDSCFSIFQSLQPDRTICKALPERFISGKVATVTKELLDKVSVFPKNTGNVYIDVLLRHVILIVNYYA
jgi:hypothetical protein